MNRKGVINLLLGLVFVGIMAFNGIRIKRIVVVDEPVSLQRDIQYRLGKKPCSDSLDLSGISDPFRMTGTGESSETAFRVELPYRTDRKTRHIPVPGAATAKRELPLTLLGEIRCDSVLLQVCVSDESGKLSFSFPGKDSGSLWEGIRVNKHRKDEKKNEKRKN